MSDKTVIFNIQFDYRAYEGTGSSNRPRQLRKAFEASGFDVIEISGVLSERGRLVDALLPRLSNQGRTLLYAESSTAPHTIDEQTKRPAASPDLRLARACHDLGIPCSLFYRDMHWRFLKPQGLKGWMIQRYYHRYYQKEIKAYADTYDLIYGPTLGLLNAAPEFNRCRKKALPPGAPGMNHVPSSGERMGFVHVGGVTGPKGLYSMQGLVLASLSAEAPLTLVCRKHDWEKALPHYLVHDFLNIEHATGQEKDTHLQQANVGLLVYEPHGYRDLAFPFKLLEYLAAGLPILVTEHTEAASFVLECGVGWSCGFDRESIARALKHIMTNPEDVEEKRRKISTMLHAHSWKARVEQIESDLWRP